MFGEARSLLVYRQTDCVDCENCAGTVPVHLRRVHLRRNCACPLVCRLTGFAEGFFVPGFHEEAAFVAEYFGFDEFYGGDSGFGDVHGGCCSVKINDFFAAESAEGRGKWAPIRARMS